MLLKEIKELLIKTGDLRKLKRKNGEVCITDLFLDGDNKIRLEKYSNITKEELNDFLHHDKITSESVDDLLGCIKLWTLFEENDNCDEFNNFEDLDLFFKNYDVDKIVEFPKFDSNDTIIEFMDSNINEMLFRTATSLN